jgi:hypothetical protein
MLRVSSYVFAMLCMASVLGCGGDSAPEIVPLKVTVKTAKGQPINQVQVRFVPQSDSLDGNFIAKGVTDDKGTCELMMPGKTESGLPVGAHKVLVADGPVSGDAREAYMRGDAGASNKEMAGRRHRPINAKYSKLQTTPLTITVSADEPEIDIVLD